MALQIVLRGEVILKRKAGQKIQGISVRSIPYKGKLGNVSHN